MERQTWVMRLTGLQQQSNKWTNVPSGTNFILQQALVLAQGCHLSLHQLWEILVEIKCGALWGSVRIFTGWCQYNVWWCWVTETKKNKTIIITRNLSSTENLSAEFWGCHSSKFFSQLSCYNRPKQQRLDSNFAHFLFFFFFCLVF